MHLFIKNSITHTPILYQNTGNNLVFHPTTAIFITPSNLFSKMWFALVSPPKQTFPFLCMYMPSY